MTQQALQDFFAAALNAGAILTGFCGTFLSFRIQREASYYRNLSSDGTDRLLDLTHFTAPLFLLLCSTICTVCFGVIIPLFHLSGLWTTTRPGRVVGGLIGGLILLIVYFVCELRHYNVLKFLENDKNEWARQGIFVAGGLLCAAGSICFFWCF